MKILIIKLLYIFIVNLLIINSKLNLTINNCKPYQLNFKSKSLKLSKSKKINNNNNNNNNKVWPIFINSHCYNNDGNDIIAYEIKSLYHNDNNSNNKNNNNNRPLWEGLYESYGITNNVPRYEYVLPNGTTFKLIRHKTHDNNFIWLIGRGDYTFKPLFYIDENNNSNNNIEPPNNNNNNKLNIWKPFDDIPKKYSKIEVKKNVYKKIKPIIKNLKLSKYKYKSKINKLNKLNSEINDEMLLNSMLHPAISIQFGKYLNKYYNNANPIPGISLDFILNSKKLLKSLDFIKSPIDGINNKPNSSHWIGPESVVYCCLDKYRLDFKHWRGTKYSRALQSIASNSRFISFLEEMTDIYGLIPMKIAKEEIIWAGSTIIGVKPGGYLLVHNDFNLMEGLHRRINVLLYLNEDWKEEWQGHLELWNHNNTKCIQRIPPMFNRMSIFTVTDDAFHGHPEPLNSPKGKYRYALQIVYYTKDAPISNNSNKPIKKRNFAKYHGAIFQPDCTKMVGLKEFCEREPQNSYQLACQCNFRSS